MKRKPTGFIAVCQCGVNVGAMDFTRTHPKEASRLLSAWIADGCQIIPKFDFSWQCEINKCKCEDGEQ